MKISRNALRKCCQPSQAGKPTGASSGSSDVPGILLHEVAHRRKLPDALGHGDRGDQQQEPDRDQPEQVEPLAVPDPHARGDPPVLRNGAREGVRIDDVFALFQLGSEAVHDLW